MLILFCMRGCGRIARPAFPAPSDFHRAGRFLQNSRDMRGEIADPHLDVIACDKRGAFAQGSTCDEAIENAVIPGRCEASNPES
jgi:hypothetical protein